MISAPVKSGQVCWYSCCSFFFFLSYGGISWTIWRHYMLAFSHAQTFSPHNEKSLAAIFREAKYINMKKKSNMKNVYSIGIKSQNGCWFPPVGLCLKNLEPKQQCRNSFVEFVVKKNCCFVFVIRFRYMIFFSLCSCCFQVFGERNAIGTRSQKK